MDGTTDLPGPTTGPAPHAATISRIVAEVAAACPGERITLGEMVVAFGDRAFGLLVLLLLLPALVPGMATVFGLPLLLLGVQMGLGRRTPSLPGFMARQSIRRADLLQLAGGASDAAPADNTSRLLRWMGGTLRRVETYVRPRPGPLTTPLGDVVFGWLTAYVAIMLILPGPGTNGPPAFGNIVMALGLVEHDSRVMAWGVALTVLGCAFATAVLVALVWLGREALYAFF